MVLTKKEILDGINNIEEHEIKALDGSIYLRPLSESELNEIDKIEAKGMGSFESTQKGKQNTTNKGKINLVKATDSSANARLKKIELSINNDKNPDAWTIEEIGSLKRDAVEEISSIIDDISGVKVTNREVENFPENE